MPITKQVVFVAKEDCIDELKALLEMMVRPSKAEPGCLLYTIYQMDEDPKTFVVVESWESEAALEGHKNTAHYKHYKSHFEPFAADKYSHNLTEIGL